MKRTIMWPAILSLATLASGAYVINSELKVYSTGGSTSLTRYTYDSKGNRISERAYGDSAAANLMSLNVIDYDQYNRRVRETLIAGTDTLKIITYTYDAVGNNTSVKVTDKAGAVNYVDSLTFGQNRLNVESRYTGGAKLFYHTFTYDTGGRKVADALYEKVGSAFSSSQTVTFEYDASNRVLAERHNRLAGGRWFLESSVIMTYKSGVLAACATYQPDSLADSLASVGILTDSLAYTVDGNGNRTLEQDYDANHALVYTINYTWTLAGSFVAFDRFVPAPAREITYYAGALRTSERDNTAVQVRIFDAAGKQVDGFAMTTASVDLRSRLRPGRYFASIKMRKHTGLLSLTIE